MGIVKTGIKVGGGEGNTVCLCGVLARGADQFNPIADVLPGAVTAYHAEGKKFYAGAFIESVVADLVRIETYGGQINLVGASMGGMLAPRVVERFRQECPDIHPDRLKVVLVDAPCGAESLTDGKAKFLGIPPIGGIAVGATSLFGIKVPVGDDMLPQPSEITVAPLKVFGEDRYFTRDETVDRIRNIARESLSGHDMSMLFDQSRVMVEDGKNGTLARAVKSLSGLDVSYLVCTMGNSPVKQPIAVNWWKPRVENLRVISVDATHCGFLQNTPQFEDAFNNAFHRRR